MDVEILCSKEAKNLKCANCAQWLSKFPIYITDDNDNICGNCVIPSDKLPMNHPFQTVAKYLVFPCKYNNLGCHQKKLPKDVIGHEIQCEYRLTKCPLEECTWKGAKLKILDHCHNKHQDLFLEQGQFELLLNINERFQSNYLLDFSSLLFVVVLKFDPSNDFLSICIFNDEKDKSLELDELLWTVQLKIGNHSLAIHTSLYNMEKQVKIHRESLKNRDLKLNIVGAISLSNFCPTNVTGKVTDHVVLRELICNSCNNYALPPIWTDPTNEQLLCYKCGSNGSFVRNMTLENCAKLIDYPCSNRKNGCGFVAKPKEMLDHFCFFPTLYCPIGDFDSCSWTGSYQNLKIHIDSLHDDFILRGFREISVKFENETDVLSDNNQSSFKFGSIATKSPLIAEHCYLTTYSNKIFRVIYRETAEHCMWSVQTIGIFKEEFFYELEIVNKNYRDKNLTMKLPCGKFVTNDDNDNIFFFSIMKKEILNFVTDEKITFKVHVFK